MRCLLVLISLGGLLLGASPASGTPTKCPDKGRPVGDGRWKRHGVPAVEVRSVRLRFTDGKIARMAAVRLSPRKFEVRLHWRDRSEWFTSVHLGQLAKKLGAAVILNAGYYDQTGRPLGYFRSGGKVFNSRVLYQGRPVALHFGALFTVDRRSGAPGIVSREKFTEAGIGEAFQAGPLLVANGRPAPGLAPYREYRRAARRTVLGLDSAGRLIVLVSESETRGTSWCELQAYLVLPESKGGLGVVRAMNLDGGSSSQLWVGGEGAGRHIPGRPAPTFVVIGEKRPAAGRRPAANR